MKILRLLFILSFGFVISCSNESGPDKSELIGLVLDYETKEPVPKAQISTIPASEVILTDDFGRFEMRTPDEGEFSVIARHKEYITAKEMIAASYDYKSNVTILMRKRDTANGAGDYAIISGNITDADTKETIENVSITLEPGTEVTYSDNSGNYNIAVIGFDTYELKFEKSGYSSVNKTLEVNELINYKLNIEMEKQGNDPTDKEPPFFTDAIYYWSFDNEDLLNHVNNKIEGYETGNILYNEGYSNKGVANNDSKSYIGMPEIDWEGLQQFTISSWIKVESFLHPTGGGLLFWGSIQNGWLGIQLAKKPLPIRTDNNYYFAASVGTVYKGEGSGSNSYSLYEPSSSYNINEWNHFVISYKLGKFDFYINGEFIGSHNQSVTIDPEAGGGLSHQWYYEGNYHLSSTTWMAAEYDELIIYNRHMNSDEVLEIKAFK